MTVPIVNREIESQASVMNTSVSISILINAQEALEALAHLVKWSDELLLAYAWVSSARGAAPHWQALRVEKVSRAVIGTQFANTEPYALHLLARHPNVLKVIEDPEGVFHPKVIVGIRGVEAWAILGSSNLTGGGFSDNTELNVLIRGPRTERPLAQVIAFIDAQWNSACAFHPDQDWLARYSEAHGRRPQPPRVLPRKDVKHAIIQSIRELDVPWNEFYALIAQQERRILACGHEIHVFDHPDGSYLQEVERCQQAFEQHLSFATMPEAKRRLVAGWGGGTSGYFGQMRGAGDFKKLTRVSPDVIAERLDRISLRGEVSLSQAGAYLQSMLQLRGVNLGTATRLLTVKRPDLFLTLNSANKQRIREIFGIAPSTVDGYLRLHARIWSMPWFSAPEPDGVDERRAWRARVALLDAVVYEKQK